MAGPDSSGQEMEPIEASLAISDSEEKLASPKDLGDAYIKWLDEHLGPEAAKRDSEAIIKLMLRAESKLQIAVMKFYLGRDNQFFDKVRERIVETARGLPRYPFFQEQGHEKQTEIQRWFFSLYVGGILEAARGDNQLDVLMREIAWSLLARDAKKVLAERDQTIDSEWLFKTMGPLIRENKYPEAIKEQLSRFNKADPKIIHVQPTTIADSSTRRVE